MHDTIERLDPSVGRNGYGMAYYTSGKNYVRFRWDTKENKLKSEQAGHAVYDRILLCDIRSPGIKDNVVKEVRFLDAEKKNPDPRGEIALRFGAELKRFLDNEAAPADGTPLEHWPRMTVEKVATLKAAGVHTVEHLAICKDNDRALQNLGPGARELAAAAQAWLSVSKDAAEAQRLAQENERKDVEIKRLNDQLAQVVARLDDLATEKKKK